MKPVELIFGVLFTVAGVYGVVTGDVYVLGDRTVSSTGQWGSFEEDPFIASFVTIFYLAVGLYGICDGLKSD